ncbi:MAG: DUF4440 domain-containing protein [Pseudomonadota bacterium]
MVRQSLAILALMALGACQTMPEFLQSTSTAHPATTPAPAATVYEPSAEQQLLDLERRLAADAQTKGLGGALGGAIDTTDGFILQPGEVLTGAEPVQQALNSGGGTVMWQPDKVFVSTGGDMGVTSGRYVQVLASGQAAQGRYLAVWRKDANGEWRLLSATRVADPATPRRR